jgi:hypothetical protein
MPVSGSGGKNSEKGWVQKETSAAIDTGLGEIIKNSNGSFDYN